MLCRNDTGKKVQSFGIGYGKHCAWYRSTFTLKTSQRGSYTAQFHVHKDCNRRDLTHVSAMHKRVNSINLSYGRRTSLCLSKRLTSLAFLHLTKQRQFGAAVLRKSYIFGEKWLVRRFCPDVEDEINVNKEGSMTWTLPSMHLVVMIRKTGMTYVGNCYNIAICPRSC